MLKNSISQKILREFGFLIGFGFPIFLGWILPAISGHDFKVWTLWVGLPSLFLGVLKPTALLPIYKAWMSLGIALGWVNSRIILGLVFLLVLQPISLIMRIFGYDPLRQKRVNKKSYREYTKNNKIDLTRIF